METTSWNSTYVIIQWACELKEPLSQMGEMAEELPELNSEEWVVLEVTSQVLSTFFVQRCILFDAVVTVT
jgi:hypothetical protein